MDTISGGTSEQQTMRELLMQMQKRHVTQLLLERKQHAAYLI